MTTPDPIDTQIDEIFEWQDFRNEYTKQFYDIMLIDGEMHENVWPNAKTFHCGNCRDVFNFEQVEFYRPNPKSQIKSLLIEARANELQEFWDFLKKAKILDDPDHVKAKKYINHGYNKAVSDMKEALK